MGSHEFVCCGCQICFAFYIFSLFRLVCFILNLSFHVPHTWPITSFNWLTIVPQLKINHWNVLMSFPEAVTTVYCYIIFNFERSKIVAVYWNIIKAILICWIFQCQVKTTQINGDEYLAWKSDQILIMLVIVLQSANQISALLIMQIVLAKQIKHNTE